MLQARHVLRSVPAISGRPSFPGEQVAIFLRRDQRPEHRLIRLAVPPRQHLDLPSGNPA
jgi:hypothetical protein